MSSPLAAGNNRLLLVLRHAPTAWNEAGRLQGRRDLHLSEVGRRLAAGWRLPGFAMGWRVLTSPLARARETALLMGLWAESETALIEMDWGAYEGKALAELRQRLGATFAANEARGLDFQPPGGESPRSVAERLKPFLARQARDGRPVVAVAHKGVLRALLALAAGWTLLGRAPVKLRRGEAQLFRLTADGRPSLVAAGLPLFAWTSAP